MLKQNLTRNISHLVSLYFTHGEVVRLGVGEVQSGDTGGGQHGQALGELYPSLLLHLQQLVLYPPCTSPDPGQTPTP